MFRLKIGNIGRDVAVAEQILVNAMDDESTITVVATIQAQRRNRRSTNSWMPTVGRPTDNEITTRSEGKQ